MNDPKNRRILLIDDNPAIHEDFEKILDMDAPDAGALNDAMSAFFDEAPADQPTEAERFELDFALQGQEGYEKVKAAIAANEPYAMAFVDVRMPPGWDGIETIAKLWEVDPDLQVVISTAYADYSRDDMVRQLGYSDRWLILKKPFDPIEVSQLASALTDKWNATRNERLRLNEVRTYAASLESANRELEVARDKAEAATRAKSSFLANMSHEIRTPMIAILGYGEMLCEPDLSMEELRDHVDTIRRSGKHLLSIIDDLLDLSRVEAGKMSIARVQCSPAEVVEDVRRIFEEPAVKKGLELSLQLEGGVPSLVRSDPVRIRQILLNLVGNAVKFTETGHVRITVRAEQVLEPISGGERSWLLAFEVQDSGIGMTNEQMARLFRPFAQADESTTRRYGGNGLGLALSKRLAQMLGGDIRLVSALGQGSTFTVTVISEVVAEPSTLSQPRPATPIQSGDGRLQARILLAEDVLTTQKLYSVYLRKSGADVVLAENGRQAVDLATAAVADGQPFDLVLMDMQMPVLDGYEATQELRAAGFDVPIVALTAHAMKGDREKCLEAGCDEYAAKPIQRVELVDLCNEVLAAYAAARSS